MIASLCAAADDRYFPPDIQRQLSLPEHQLDIGLAALTFAKEIYPDLDVAAYSKRIDEFADKARRLGQGTTDPEKRIRVLNTVLFKQEGIRYDRAVLARNQQAYYFLNGILDTRLGICYTMPLLYIAVAQRLGWPMYPVAAPDHLFVRYVDESFKEQNIETTSGGKYFPDEVYAKDFSVGAQSLASGSYLRTLSYREFLSYLLAANALVLARQGRGNKTVAYLEKATELNPRFADYHDTLGEAYLAMSRAVSGEEAANYQDKAKRSAAKAKALGYVSQEVIAMGRETRGR